MPIKTIFLDRDGVINQELNYLFKIEDFVFIDGIFEACLNFQKLGYKIIIITNQSGIARGYYTESEYKKLTHWMLTQFKDNNIDILEVFHCPHSLESNCNCRKPRAGMFIEAKDKYDIDMEKSWMIGDKETDIEAANMAKIKNTLLVRSGHKINDLDSNAKYILSSIKQSEQVIIR